MIEQYFSGIKTKWLILILFVLTFIVFSPALWFNFLLNYDDDALIIENMVIRSLSWNGLYHMFSTFVYGLYHPLVTLSFAVDYFLFGLNPFGYHLTNITLHAINCILVFYFLMNLFPGSRGVSFFISILFAIHPLHIESVAWISGRKDLLYVLFYLLGLLTYLNYCKTKSVIMYSFTIMLFIFSLFSKSAAVSFPLVMLVINYIRNDKIFSWPNIFRVIPFFLLSFIFGIINIYAQQSDNFIRDISGIYSIFNRIILVLYSLVYYIQISLFPFTLCPKHFYPEITDGWLPNYMYIMVFTILPIILYFNIRKRLNRIVIAGLVFYLVTIFFMLKIIPTGNDFVSDRYAYLAIIGVFFPLFLIKKFKKVLFFLGISLISINCYYFYSYIFYWKDSVQVWTKVLQEYPDNFLAFNERGQAFLYEKNYSKAIEDLNKSLKISPSTLAYMNLGLTYSQLNNPHEAINFFLKAQKIDSSNNIYIYKQGVL